MDSSTGETTVRRCSQCNTAYTGGERFCPLDGGAILDPASGDDPMIGRRIAHRYLIKQLLGKGGMGEVYLADHVGLDKPVALKFILERYTEDPDVLTRFHREARTATRIGHDNIIDITDVGESEDGRHYIVMEYLEGSDLGRTLKHSGAMPVRRALHIIEQVLAGLAAAHEKGVIHRDMKPENVYLTVRGGISDFVKIMDFGISKFIAAHDSKVRLTETGAVIGTPIYMAPEQAQAMETIDHRADIYAVGVMLYEMLCGTPPFNAPSYLALVTQHLHDEPPPMRSHRPDLPEALDRAVLRALAKRPEDRFQSATEFSRALRGAAGGAEDPSDERFAATLPHGAAAASAGEPGVYAAPTAGAPEAASRRKRTPLLWIAAAAVIAAAGISAAALWTGAGAGAGEGPGEPKVDSLEILSQPEGARVFLNGEAKGATPLYLEGLEPGTYELRLELEGYETVEASRDLRVGKDEAFLVTLAPRGSEKEGSVSQPPEHPIARPEPEPEPSEADQNDEPQNRPRPRPKPRPRPRPKPKPEPSGTGSETGADDEPQETPKPKPKPKPRPKQKPDARPTTKPNPYLDN